MANRALRRNGIDVVQRVRGAVDDAAERVVSSTSSQGDDETPAVERGASKDEDQEQRPISGDCEPVDHDRQAGVPPPSTDDYDDIVDIEGAESFPASDPPSGW